MSKKLYIVGGGGRDGSWLEDIGWTLTNRYNEADGILLTGGADIDPKYYNQMRSTRTYPSPQRDIVEYSAFKQAVSDGKYIFGICRGLQGIHAYQGFPLIQHIDNHVCGSHEVISNVPGIPNFNAPSCHHQNPQLFKGAPIEVLGYAEPRSKTYIGEHDEEIELDYPTKEVEALYYPKIRALGVQYHPEWCRKGSSCWESTQAMVLDVFPETA